MPLSLPSRAWWDAQFPGLAVAGCAALAAQFLSDHYGAPAMLMAILIGMSLHFLAEETRAREGIDTAARSVLRIGVALLGLRVSAEMVMALGWPSLLLVLGALAATIGFGLVAARLSGQSRAFGFLTGGAVAICGASAAMAIAAVLPRRGEAGERDLAFTVVGVTVLSTLAMIVYPILTARFGLDTRATGLFLGATIHDVAQVVGAGFSIDEPTGELSTLVKLIRVTALAPVVLIAAIVLRAQGEAGGARPPLLPGFVIAFLVLAAVNSTGYVPQAVTDLAAASSRWALLTAIAAVGMKSSLPRLLEVGRPALALILGETLFLAALVLAGLWLLG
ncbi:MAG TPA: putative sulfate exporter family transporter [Paracoccaceae bacterium]|nr:putative sulfate exporter family transporter [Paracoccaceae bacterium]HMO71613.1 putative sulfate exporter family transporter [Paracoccaceae bacterium]